jgi:hypothetical protein
MRLLPRWKRYFRKKAGNTCARKESAHAKNIFAFIKDGGDERDFHEKELSWRLFSVAITTDG